eukprot:1190050-Prorocentrum_minimum.AAC.5
MAHAVETVPTVAFGALGDLHSLWVPTLVVHNVGYRFRFGIEGMTEPTLRLIPPNPCGRACINSVNRMHFPRFVTHRGDPGKCIER